jgi:hypothetical protein
MKGETTMKNKLLFGLAVFLILGVLLGCSNGSTDTSQGIYDGIGVWLVGETEAIDWGTADYEGQPRPTAIGFLDNNISNLPESFSVNLLEPFDFSGDDSGAWAAKDPNENWTAVPGDYYVFLVPMYWSLGVSGQGNMEWHFGAGKVSASDDSAKQLNIISNKPTLSLSDFQNWSDIP